MGSGHRISAWGSACIRTGLWWLGAPLRLGPGTWHWDVSGLAGSVSAVSSSSVTPGTAPGQATAEHGGFGGTVVGSPVGSARSYPCHRGPQTGRRAAGAPTAARVPDLGATPGTSVALFICCSAEPYRKANSTREGHDRSVTGPSPLPPVPPGRDQRPVWPPRWQRALPGPCQLCRQEEAGRDAHRIRNEPGRRLAVPGAAGGGWRSPGCGRGPAGGGGCGGESAGGGSGTSRPGTGAPAMPGGGRARDVSVAVGRRGANGSAGTCWQPRPCLDAAQAEAQWRG